MSSHPWRPDHLRALSKDTGNQSTPYTHGVFPSLNLLYQLCGSHRSFFRETVLEVKEFTSECLHLPGTTTTPPKGILWGLNKYTKCLLPYPVWAGAQIFNSFSPLTEHLITLSLKISKNRFSSPTLGTKTTSLGTKHSGGMKFQALPSERLGWNPSSPYFTSLCLSLPACKMGKIKSLPCRVCVQKMMMDVMYC